MPSAKSQVIQGIGVSPGVVMGPVFLLRRESVDVREKTLAPDEVDAELDRFEKALIETRRQIKNIQADMEKEMGQDHAGIFDAHLMVLDDKMFIGEVVEDIMSRHRNSEAVVKQVAAKYAGVLASVGDDYLRERTADVRDVARRIIRNLIGEEDLRVQAPDTKHIVIANDLAPSETAALRKDIVIGFATDMGSPTSHTAVMARALEIPAIVALHDVSVRVSQEDQVLIDGNKGVLIVNPDERELEKYGKLAAARQSIQEDLSGLRDEPAETRDGHRIVLSANIEGPEEVAAVQQYGAEGIGLFRSEYLYLSKDKIVGEAEQAEVYSDVAKRLKPLPVIIRTLDLGGDKYLPDAGLPGEANPFLGCRSIRLSLRYPDHFRAQLRAILAASAQGNVGVMYPMISSAEEVVRANEILESAKEELRAKGAEFDENIKVGAMIEIPSAALTAQTIAEHVDFMSLGTNDLVQYTIAVDRVNENVAYLYEPAHPAVLKLIKSTVDAGHDGKIWVGVCGEMAADPIMTPLLIGLGVDELSVAPSATPLVKDAVRSIRLERARELAETCLNCRSAVDVLGNCRELINEAAPELLELV